MSVEIAGIYMDRSINDFVRGCEAYIENEQAKLAPDTWLIALLCDAVRVTRELTKARTGQKPWETTPGREGEGDER